MKKVRKLQVDWYLTLGLKLEQADCTDDYGGNIWTIRVQIRLRKGKPAHVSVPPRSVLRVAVTDVIFLFSQALEHFKWMQSTEEQQKMQY